MEAQNPHGSRCILTESFSRTRQLLSCFENCLIFRGTKMFIVVLTRALHWPLSWAIRIQCIPLNPVSLRYVLLLSSHLRLGFPSMSFWLSHLNSRYIPLHPMRNTFPSLLTLHDLITLIILGGEAKLYNSSLHSFLQLPIISTLLDPNAHLSTS
jgi:hypothetical protein